MNLKPKKHAWKRSIPSFYPHSQTDRQTDRRRTRHDCSIVTFKLHELQARPNNSGGMQAPGKKFACKVEMKEWKMSEIIKARNLHQSRGKFRLLIKARQISTAETRFSWTYFPICIWFGARRFLSWNFSFSLRAGWNHMYMLTVV